jgi:hypothetical protein
MNKLLAGLLGFGAVLGAGAFFLQRATNAELQSEIAGLRAEVRQLAQQHAAATREEPKTVAVATTTAESLRAEADRAEVAQLREDLDALRKSTQQVARVAQAAQQAARGESPVPVKLTPATELKNVGRATAPAAVETLLAAAFGGDVDGVARAILLEPSAQAKADEYFSQLSEATRAQYGSSDKLIALMLAKDAAALAGMQVLGQRDLSPEVVGVRVRLATEDGKMKEQGLAFQKTTDGLRLKIPDDVVEKYAKQIRGGK